MNKISEAFNAIRAEDPLKQNTLAYIRQHSTIPCRVLPKLTATMCVLAILLGGVWLYLTPTARLAIETTPSVELTVNAFDRVISASGSNSAAQNLLTELDLINLSYAEAMDRILSTSANSGFAEEDGVLSIGVIAPEGPQAQRMLLETQTRTNIAGDALCYRTSPETAEQAQNAGLSCGKYRILLELQQWDPHITPDQVRSMTMKQLRSWLRELEKPETDDPTPEPTAPEPAATDPTDPPETEPTNPGNHNGNGQGNGHQHGNGK